MYETITHVIPTVLSIIGGFGVVAFTLLYAWFSNWRETRAGRAIMYLSSALSLMMVLVTVHLFIRQDYAGRDELRTVVYAYVAWAGVQLPFALIRTLREHDPNLFSVDRMIPARLHKLVVRWNTSLNRIVTTWKTRGKIRRSKKES